jgi:Pretoxin HINT domain
VTGRSSRLAQSVVHLTLQDPSGRQERITATPNHPYLVAANDNAPGPRLVAIEPGGLWTAAGQLQPGDRIESVEGRALKVISVDLDLRPTRVFNLEVEEMHSFAVGEQGAWVHNSRAKPPAPGRPTPKDGFEPARKRSLQIPSHRPL